MSSLADVMRAVMVAPGKSTTTAQPGAGGSEAERLQARRDQAGISLNASLDRMLAERGLAVAAGVEDADASAPDDAVGASLNASMDGLLAKMGLAPVERRR